MDDPWHCSILKPLSPTTVPLHDSLFYMRSGQQQSLTPNPKWQRWH